jgi:hypothetical protein
MSFSFARPERKKPSVKKWSEINLDLDKDRLWAVDPGITDIFVACDNNQGQHEIRKTSSKEYYHMCGFNLSNQKIAMWKRQNQDIAIIEKNMPSAKTSNLLTFDAYITYMNFHGQTICNFYDARFAKQKFKRYIKKQQAISEICRRLTHGENLNLFHCFT